MRQIPIKLPLAFEEALGYSRGLKWAAFYWEPCGDEAMFYDGLCSADCNWAGFLAFVRHPKVKPWLADYDFGSSDTEAKHWLLCDLETRELFAGMKAEVGKHIDEQILARLPEGTLADEQINLSAEDIKEIIAKMKEVPAPSMEAVMEKMRRDDEAIKNMVAQLDKK